MGKKIRSMTNWAAYFDGLRQDSPLYREQSALYVRLLAATVELHRRQRVLDFGCGFGFVAALIAPLVGELWLWDPSPNMRSVAKRNTAAFPNVRFCNLAAIPSVNREGTPLQVHRMDLILVNSVAQYMPSEDLSAWLVQWRQMLAPDGKLVLSDLIAPGHSGISDIVDLLRLGARHGSALRATREALGGLVHYWRTSRAVPLTRIGLEDLGPRAADAGLDIMALSSNLTHFSRRWAAVLSPRAPRP
jgi:SAM-dependent methyltransferase